MQYCDFLVITARIVQRSCSIVFFVFRFYLLLSIIFRFSLTSFTWNGTVESTFDIVENTCHTRIYSFTRFIFPNIIGFFIFIFPSKLYKKFIFFCFNIKKKKISFFFLFSFQKTNFFSLFPFCLFYVRFFFIPKKTPRLPLLHIKEVRLEKKKNLKLGSHSREKIKIFLLRLSFVCNHYSLKSKFNYGDAQNFINIYFIRIATTTNLKSFRRTIMMI